MFSEVEFVIVNFIDYTKTTTKHHMTTHATNGNFQSFILEIQIETNQDSSDSFRYEYSVKDQKMSSQDVWDTLFWRKTWSVLKYFKRYLKKKNNVDLSKAKSIHLSTDSCHCYVQLETVEVATNLNLMLGSCIQEKTNIFENASDKFKPF